MGKKYQPQFHSEAVVIIGDNFIVEHLYENFKRFSKMRIFKMRSVNEINIVTNYIIDCTFNEKSQHNILKYSTENNIKKVIILNHWKNVIDEIKDLVVVQAIIPDVYGEEHESFNRPGPGNSFDDSINYCSLICESIRRIHEAKVGFIPNLYINYDEEVIKYLYVENLYEPVQYIIDNIVESSEYEVYDEQKNIGVILDTIKNIIEYKGMIIFENTRTSFSKPIKKLPYKHSYKSFSNNIKNIYRYLLYNSQRFNI